MHTATNQRSWDNGSSYWYAYIFKAWALPTHSVNICQLANKWRNKWINDKHIRMSKGMNDHSKNRHWKINEEETCEYFLGVFQSIKNALFPLWCHSFIKFVLLASIALKNMTQKIENQNALNHSKTCISSVQPKWENLIEHLSKQTFVSLPCTSYPNSSRKPLLEMG